MTGKTTKDVQQDAEDVDAVETEDSAAQETAAPEATGARPAAKRKRRVRVIEVLDDDDDGDDDLEDVLEALDQEDEPKPKKTPAARAVAKSSTRREPVSLDKEDPPQFAGMGRTQAIVVIVVVAALASLGIWQWRVAAGLSSQDDARAEVSKVASEYGDVALNYNASNYQTQMQKAQALMGGDLLESFKQNTLPNLGNTFKQNPQLVLTSKTDQVFIGGVDERFASATISVDVSVKTNEGVNESPATLIRLALAKIDGRWKVTKMYASGVNDQNANQQGGLPAAPTSPSASPSPTGSEKN